MFNMFCYLEVLKVKIICLKATAELDLFELMFFVGFFVCYLLKHADISTEPK